jgi:hypothetical protein
LFASLLETQENLDLMVGLGVLQYSFHWQQGSPHIPEPRTHHSADSYLWGVSQLSTKLTISAIFQDSGCLYETAFDNAVFLECGKEGKEQTDAYGCHAINSQYIVRTASKTCRTSCLRTTHRACHEFAETLPAQASGARMETPSYVFECYTVWSGLRERIHLREQFVFGKEFVFGGQVVFRAFVFRIRLREVIRSSEDNSASGKFVFREQFVFGEFVFAIRLRDVIRLRGAIRLRGIRLRNSSSSAGGSVLPAQRAQCI